MFVPAFNSVSFLCSIFLSLLLGPINLTSAQGGGGIELTGTGGRHRIQGRIYFPSGLRADSRLKVRLESLRDGELSVLADANGAFSFRSLLPGSYTVVVEGGKEYETVRETVFIDGEVSSPRSGVSLPSVTRAYQVQIHLQVKRVSVAASKPGVINVALASVPEPARKAYERALELAKAGDSKKAIEELKQAISFYPGFALALNELGVQHLKLGQPEQAVEALRSAVKLAPEAFSARLNYGIALLQKKNFTEARAQLQEALKRNSSSPTVHLYLGITLINDARYSDAEREFKEALINGGETVSLAHYYLGGLYWRKRDYKLAADELEKYVQLTPTAHDAEKVRLTIKELRSKQ